MKQKMLDRWIILESHAQEYHSGLNSELHTNGPRGRQSLQCDIVCIIVSFTLYFCPMYQRLRAAHQLLFVCSRLIFLEAFLPTKTVNRVR